MRSVSLNRITVRASADRFDEWWGAHHRAVLTLAIGVMTVAAIVWLVYEFWRLLFQGGEWGAVDLRLIQGWVNAWFSPAPPIGLFPPATYPMLWPLMGWLPFDAARWLWAATTVAALSWLCSLTVRHSLAHTAQERAVAALMPLAIAPTGAAIGNGQLVVHIMPVLLTAVLRCSQHDGRAWRDAMAAACMLLALVKPTIAAPFFWIFLFAGRSPRPAFLVILGYTLLTWFAVTFKDDSIVAVVSGWMSRSAAAAALPGEGNVSNVNVWLAAIGRREWAPSVSMLLLVAFGLWTHRHRRTDLWLLLGVAGYVSRLWTYHRWYEDLLVLPAMIVLFRLTKLEASAPGTSPTAGLLLALTLLFMLAPGGLFTLPPPLDTVYVAAQLVVWLLGLAFLVACAERTLHEHVMSSRPQGSRAAGHSPEADVR
jgi:Glycosyltransferase family 87